MGELVLHPTYTRWRNAERAKRAGEVEAKVAAALKLYDWPLDRLLLDQGFVPRDAIPVDDTYFRQHALLRRAFPKHEERPITFNDGTAAVVFYSRSGTDCDIEAFLAHTKYQLIRNLGDRMYSRAPREPFHIDDTPHLE